MNRRERLRIDVRLGFLVFVIVLAFPSTAHALPNPFTVVFAVDMLFQAFLVAMLLIPKAANATKRFVNRYVPSSSWRTVGLVVVLAATSAALSANTLVDRTVTPVAASFEQRLQACKPLSEQEAEAMGLRPNRLIVDVRPPSAFAAYHLVRSCNLTAEEIFYKAQRIRDHVGAIEGIYLAAEYEIASERVFEDDYPIWTKFFLLPGGLKGHYKNGNREFGWGPAPNLVVDAEGRPVNVQVGPFWFMGRYSAFPTPDAWRRVPESAFVVARQKGAPIIDLRGKQCADHALCLPPWRAFASSISYFLNEKHAGALFICDQPHECLLAAGMGVELASKGLNPMGYLQVDSHWTPKSSAALTGHFGQLVPYAVIVGIIAISAAAWHLVRRFVRRLRHPRLRILASCAGVLAILLSAAMTSWAIGPYLDPEAPATRWMTYYLSDARSLGFPHIVALLLIAPITLVHLGERALGRRSRLLRGAMIVGCIAMVAHADIRLGLNVFAVVLLCASVLGPVLVEVGETIWAVRVAKRGSGLRWIPLSGAIEPSIVGSKAYWLGRTARDGMAVPEGLILLGRPNDTIDRQRLERTVRARLGSGPMIVRSSAPDEDEEGSLTAGRYRSIAVDSVSEVFEAVQSVFADYVEKGINGDAEAAVLIQHQVEAEWAGIAVRAPLHRGGGIQVECSPGTNVNITSGRGAERVGHLGAISKRWLEEGQAPPISEKALAEIFDRYEPRLGGPIQIEWAWERGTLILFQIRRAPKEDNSLVPLDTASSVLSRLQTSLQWIARRPSTLVLQVGELSDYRATSRATEELFATMWDRDGGHRYAARLLRNSALPKPPKPAIVRIDGCLYENLVSDAPVRRLLSLPIHRLGRLWLRARIGSRIAWMQSELERWQLEPIRIEASPSQSPREAAEQILELRKRLVEGPGAIAVAVSLLDQAWRGKGSKTPKILGDALLSDLAAGVDSDELARRHPRRAIPDLALERPRLGETRASEPLPAPPDSPPGASPRGIDEELAFLRGRARVLLSEYAAELRHAHLRLGRLLQRDDVFEITEEALRELAESNVASSPPLPCRGRQQSVPLTVRLIDLERWAAHGEFVAGLETQRKQGGFWAGDPQPCEGVVAPPDEPWVGEGRPVVIVDVPTVELMASIANDFVVVARAGTRLCHAAMIARERGIIALFGAGDAVLELSVGDRVRLHRSGTVERIGASEPKRRVA